MGRSSIAGSARFSVADGSCYMVRARNACFMGASSKVELTDHLERKLTMMGGMMGMTFATLVWTIVGILAIVALVILIVRMLRR